MLLLTMTSTVHRNRPSGRFLRGDGGELTEVCHKGSSGGSSVEYTQSPVEQMLLMKLLPIMDFIFPGGPTGGSEYASLMQGMGGGPWNWGVSGSPYGKLQGPRQIYTGAMQPQNTNINPFGEING